MILIVTFTLRNTFFTLFELEKKKVFFVISSGQCKLKYVSKDSDDALIDTMRVVCMRLKRLHITELMLVFKGIGYRSIFIKRYEILSSKLAYICKALGESGVYISSIFDKSKISFNGCRKKKHRRKRLFRQHQFFPLIPKYFENDAND